ncbi:MAG: hypothetical protein WCQ20_03990 [Synechococcaceae cyanobacterium ELA739]|jgi:hypothetical protein
MGWDPSVLRKYNTTGHFRLLNQLRSELKGNPLVRPKQGETVGEANRSRSLIRAIEARSQAGPGRSRRAAQASEVTVMEAASLPATDMPRALSSYSQQGYSEFAESEAGANSTFRERLNAIDMR